MKIMNVLIANLVLLMLCTTGAGFAVAQNNQNNEEGFNRFSIGLGGGVITSFTDIKENPFLPDGDEITYGGRLSLNYHLSPVFTLQTNFLYGELKGIDTEQNLSFETDLLEATLNARISFNTLFRPESEINQRVNFYGFVGAGLLAYRSRLMENGTPINYYGYTDGGQTSDDLKPEFVVPYGIGVNFKVSERFDLGIESGFRYTSSDRLDAFPNRDDGNDIYNFTGITLTFRLGRNTNSMDWAPPSQVMYPGDVRRMDDLEQRIDGLAGEVEDLHGVHDQYDSELGDLKVRMDGLSEETAEIMQRTVRLFGAVEDLADEVSKLSDEVEQVRDTKHVRFYAVQVLAIKDRRSVEDVRQQLRITYDVEKYYIDGYFKYIAGNHEELEDAILHMQRLWGQGVRDAFVVEYRDGTLFPR